MDSRAHSTALDMAISLAAKTTKARAMAHMVPAMGETTTAAAIVVVGVLAQATAIKG